MKKIISLLLTIAVLVSSMIFSASAETTPIPASETTDLEKINEQVDTIFALDIMQPNTDGLMELSGKATRGDVIMWLYRMFNYKNRDVIPQSSSSYFTDIGIYHYAAGYIGYMVSRGIVRGYADGTFRPDDIITYDEIKKILSSAAGYKNAQDLTFDFSVSDEDKDGITRKTAAEMLYKLMFTDIRQITSGKYDVSDNEEFIKAIMNLDYFDGVLDGVGGVSLYNKNISDKLISVDGIEYSINTEMNTEYLGYYGRCYIDTNSDDTAILFYPSEKNNVLEITSDQIQSYKNYEYSYYNENYKLKRVKLIKGFDCIYNDYYNEDTSLMVPEYGSVKLISNDRDGKYDVVIIKDIDSYVVDRIINGEEFVFNNTDENGNNIIIDTKKLDECKVYLEDGSETTLSVIKSGNVVNVMSNSANRAKFVVSNTKIKGTLSAVSDEDGYLYMTIDDVIYKSIPKMYNDVWDGKSLIKISLLLDANGRVAGVSEISGDSWEYGYIIKEAYYDEEMEAVRLKLLKQDGKLEIINCAKKVYLDGVMIKNPVYLRDQLNNAYLNFNEFTEVDSSGQGNQKHENFTTRLIRYYLDKDGEIFKLDTPVKRSFYEDATNVQSNENTLAIRSKGYIYYAPEQNMMKFIYNGDFDIAGDMVLNSGAPVFVIPKSDNTDPDDDDYFVVNNLNKVGFNQYGEFCYASGYSSNPESLTCDAIVVRSSSGTSSDSSIMIFDSIYKSYDETEGEVVDMVKFISKGKMQEQRLSDEEMGLDASTLRTGDVIIYNLKDSKVLLNKLLYTSSGTGLLNTSSSYPTGSPTYNISYRVLVGKVGKTDGTTIHLKMEDNALFDEILKSSTITVYDASIGTKDAQFKCVPSELRTIEKNGNNADTIIVSSKLGYIQDVVVVRY